MLSAAEFEKSYPHFKFPTYYEWCKENNIKYRAVNSADRYKDDHDLALKFYNYEKREHWLRLQQEENYIKLRQEIEEISKRNKS